MQIGGIPLALGHDNGGELRSGQVQTMLRRLGIASKRTYPYMKHLNGKVERVQQTMQDELGQQLPGFAAGPKTLKLRDLLGLDAKLLTEELFTALLLNWVEEYNTERPHGALEGRTPLQAWSEQHTPLRQPDMESVRLAMMLEDRPRKVTADGVSFRQQLYTSGELAALRIVDQMVTVRYLPHDDSFIELFDGDTWLCTAVKAHQVDTEGRLLMQEVHRDQYLTARSYLAAARDRRQLAAATATLDTPALAPLSSTIPSLLSGGDDDLLELAETDIVPSSGPPPPAAANDVINLGGHDDPWELAPPDDDLGPTTAADPL